MTAIQSIRTITFLSLIAMLASCGSAQEEPKQSGNTADIVYTNGKFYTVNENQPWAEAVAIKGGKFLAVGSKADVEAVIGDFTAVIDLDGKFAMPGIHDLHLHLSNIYAQEFSGELLFSDRISKAEVEKSVRDYIAANPDVDWIRGNKWGLDLFDNGIAKKDWVNSINAEKAIFLIDSTGHNAVANSKALELAGITKDTPNPPGGVIHHLPNGEPSGYVSETAMGLIGKYFAPANMEAKYLGLLKSMADIRSYGITSLKDPMVNEETVRAYRQLENEGKLPHRVMAATLADDYQAELIDYETFRELAPRLGDLASERINTKSIKWFGDGTPMSQTALLVDPYPTGKDDFGSMGIFEKDFADIVEYHKQGFQATVHATGDGTVRKILDLIEESRAADPQPGLLHHIAHSNLVHPDDYSRFNELGVAAEFSPRTLWYPSELSKLAYPAVGNEMMTRWSPMRQLLNAGALVVYGSDWPAGTPDADPWAALQILVTRTDPSGEYDGRLGDPVTMEEAIQIMTLNGAKLMMHETETGSIEVGKYADFIVLDRNLLEAALDELGGTKVEKTVLEGEVVYER